MKMMEIKMWLKESEQFIPFSLVLSVLATAIPMLFISQIFPITVFEVSIVLFGLASCICLYIGFLQMRENIKKGLYKKSEVTEQ